VVLVRLQFLFCTSTSLNTFSLHARRGLEALVRGRRPCSLAKLSASAQRRAPRGPPPVPQAVITNQRYIDDLICQIEGQDILPSPRHSSGGEEVDGVARGTRA